MPALRVYLTCTAQIAGTGDYARVRILDASGDAHLIDVPLSAVARPEGAAGVPAGPALLDFTPVDELGHSTLLVQIEDTGDAHPRIEVACSTIVTSTARPLAA